MIEHVSQSVPFARFADFLSPRDHGSILRWTLTHPHRFEPALITDNRSRTVVLDTARRNALISSDFPEIQTLIVNAFKGNVDKILEGLSFRGSRDFDFEVELSAYGHGAHFFPHVDISIGKAGEDEIRLENDRRLYSAVYYFHRQPKGFAGGELKLFGFPVAGNDLAVESSGMEIEPEDNSLVIFPSWVPHQVQPVICPSHSFEDHRFAINCWLRRREEPR